MKGQGLAEEDQEVTVKSGGREGLARGLAFKTHFQIGLNTKRGRKSACHITLSGWTPAIGACDDTARLSLP